MLLMYLLHLAQAWAALTGMQPPQANHHLQLKAPLPTWHTATAGLSPIPVTAELGGKTGSTCWQQGQ